MTTPTQEDLKAYLAEKLVTLDERVAAVCADPAVTDRLSGPVLSLAQLRAIVESHNAGARTEWSPDELAQLIVFVGDLLHDVDLVREMIAFPQFRCFPRVLRDERLGETRG